MAKPRTTIVAGDALPSVTGGGCGDPAAFISYPCTGRVTDALSRGTIDLCEIGHRPARLATLGAAS